MATASPSPACCTTRCFPGQRFREIHSGLRADLTSSTVLNVFSNIFQGNTQGALYFNPSSGNKIAQVVVVTNVFSTNGGLYGGAVTLENFDTLFLATNLIEGNYKRRSYSPNRRHGCHGRKHICWEHGRRGCV